MSDRIKIIVTMDSERPGVQRTCAAFGGVGKAQRVQPLRGEFISGYNIGGRTVGRRPKTASLPNRARS